MKKLIFTLIAFVVLSNFFANAQSGWQWIYPVPVREYLNSVKFLNSDIGYVVGQNGAIIKTTNGGNKWISLISGTTRYLYSVDFTSTNIGYAVGMIGTIIKTSNGGANWTTQISGTSEDLNSIYFTQPDTGYAVGSGGIILKTTNGGTNWAIKTSGTTEWFHSVCFADTKIGYIVGFNGIILKTTNGGDNWVQQNSGTPYDLYSVNFVDTNIGYAVGGDFNGGNPLTVFLKTTDGGANWINVPNNIGHLYSVCFADANTGYVTGGSTILKTTNGGNNWIKQADVTGFGSIYMLDSITGYVVGQGGTVLKTSDGGTSWVLQTDITKNRLSSLCFPSTHIGYAVGVGGTIIKTTNNGVNWKLLTSGTNIYLYSVFFTDTNTGYAAGSTGTILKTTNGGTSWTNQISGTNGVLECIYFTDANIGYAMGGAYSGVGNILKTTNGGNNWTPLSSGTTNGLNSAYFTSTNTGYVVGNSGTILKTTDGGINWTNQISGTLENFYSVCFTSENIGYTVSCNGTVFKTTNGGNVWTNISSTSPSCLISICYTDANTGYAAANYNASIFKTTNAGLTWVKQINETVNLLNSICFTDANTGYAVGDEGAILKTYTGGEPIDPFVDNLNIFEIADKSDSIKCKLPYYSKIFLNTAISGNSYQIGDTITWKIDFGDGSDTTISDTIQNIPQYIAKELPHIYYNKGDYNLNIIVSIKNKKIDTLVVSDFIYITDSCNNINGIVFLDKNNNCNKDYDEVALPNQTIKVYRNSKLYSMDYSNENGNYGFFVPNKGSYYLKLDTIINNGLHLNCIDSIIPITNSFTDTNIAYICPTNFDLYSSLTALRFRPGENANLYLNVYNNSCSPITGKVKLILDTLTNFVSSIPAAVISGDTLIWNFTALDNTSFLKFSISLFTKTTAIIGDSVCFKVIISPDKYDFNPNNNTLIKKFPIRNSWDPNMKEVTPTIKGNGILPNQELIYTIYFQNKGNAEAININIFDTLDKNFDISTFKVLTYSHQPIYITMRYDSMHTILKFNFPDIFLKDDKTSEIESHGFVTYSVKLKENLPFGTKVNNTAFIYFDYNPAVVTNTLENEITDKVIKHNSIKSNNLVIFPNPATNIVILQKNDYTKQTYTLSIRNIQGQEVLSKKIMFANTYKLDLTNLTKGMYFLTLQNDKESHVSKVVKQ
ncbi:MAG: YCF48-related protein [Bacteroidales bacterium]|nr:YCF48-related protein [Bacteroidales bacterium]